MKNLLVTGYTTGILKIIGQMLLAVAIFSLTIYFAYIMESLLFGFLQTVTSLVLLICSLVLAWTSFIVTLLLIIVLSGIFYFGEND
ncbi:hypothetical protein JMUB7465_04050 [Staphylococcus aureus]|nr:hypothetical protein [Staphylococcus aureus]EMS38767.1 Putative membrane protein [Staphylococcus aureus KLT6]ETO50770.1 hypothetical protein Y001_12525 [Staphylococcus aureus MUF256]ETO56206.1 hypothetical protein Y003_08455 [Staphylococcus aureus MUM475]OHR95323.1 hypothetical protein HMPREF3247_03485 [Staphylococcus sp. HMSC36A10]CAG42144.1 putative membrane protein [Staphylococcus aureus subsp. aureus MSSA476]